MKNQFKTVLQTLAERLREQASRFNPSLEAALRSLQPSLGFRWDFKIH